MPSTFAHDAGERRLVAQLVSPRRDPAGAPRPALPDTPDYARFPRIAGDIAAHLGSVDSDGVEAMVADSLRQIGEALQLDYAVLWHQAADDAVAVPVHHWVRPPLAAPGPRALALMPTLLTTIETGAARSFTRPADLTDAQERDAARRHGVRSGLLVPLTSGRHTDGSLRALSLGTTWREEDWPPDLVEQIRLVGGVLSQALARRADCQALQQALAEIRQLRDRLASENVELRREVKGLRTSRMIVAESGAIRQVISLVEQVAPTPATVLLLGETGTGKEVMAQAIHELSPRHRRPMVRVSCAAIPAALIESELFGREKGAYTGALSRQIGRFEAANQSTIFLDEIGELPPETQVKLLRVIQERVIERLGSTQSVKVDVRIIAATNRNLEEAVQARTFREDLFYRLNVFPIVVPPLRDRVEDIPALVWSFVDEFSQLFGKTIESVSKESLRELQRYAWPGNVRELRNIVERAVIVSTDRQLVVPPPRAGVRTKLSAAMTLTELETDHIRAVLEATNWRVRGKGGAAERLGLKPTTLDSRIAKLGITRRPEPHPIDEVRPPAARTGRLAFPG
jgi:transcriptional regulator with GAF, ATPase, and Fis domain